MKRAFGIAALGAVCAGPALADVTPQQVWDNLSGTMRTYGYTVDSRQEAQGNDLRVTDIVMSGPLSGAGEDEMSGEFRFTISELTLTDNSDGSVDIAFPGTMPIVIDVADDDEEAQIRIDYGQTGLEMTASGDPDDIAYDYTAEELVLALAGLSGNDLEPEVAEALDFRVTMGPVEGSTGVAETDAGQRIVQDMRLGDLDYAISFEDPESDDSGSFSGRMTSVVSEATSLLPAGSDLTDPAMLASAGLTGSGVFTHQGGETDFTVSEDGTTVARGQLSSESASLEFEMEDGSFTYDVSGTGNAIDLSVQDLPFPIVAEIAESRLALTLPLTPAEDDGTRDAALALDLSGFTMAEEIWAIFDPTRVLPRDPATIALDLTAKVTPYVNFFDPEAIEQMEDEGGMPGEVNAVTLNELRVEAVGSSLTGEGAFSFDNSAVSLGGPPQPEGEVTLKATGINTLVDALISMGLMAEEDAMGMRMMMAMFTVPGDAPDSVTSTIEINEQGHVLANGQRIQ